MNRIGGRPRAGVGLGLAVALWMVPAAPAGTLPGSGRTASQGSLDMRRDPLGVVRTTTRPGCGSCSTPRSPWSREWEMGAASPPPGTWSGGWSAIWSRSRANRWCTGGSRPSGCSDVLRCTAVPARRSVRTPRWAPDFVSDRRWGPGDPGPLRGRPDSQRPVRVRCGGGADSSAAGTSEQRQQQSHAERDRSLPAREPHRGERYGRSGAGPAERDRVDHRRPRHL